MELRHLRYFIAVAEELHFGRAAERLFMAQPPLSQQIRQLEREMGVTLFKRNNRRVQLTPAGEVFLEEARGILAMVDSAVGKARRAAGGETGWLGIGFVSSVAYDILPTILRQFRERYPEVELVLLEIPGVEQWEALRENRIHVGFIHIPTEEPGIVTERVAVNTVMVALPISHPLAKRDAIEMYELANEPFILCPQQPGAAFARFVIHQCQLAGFEPRIVQKTGEMPTAVSLVDAGIGIAIVPASVHNLRRDGVVYRPIVNPIPTIELAMGYRAADQSPVLRNFIEIARSVVRSGAES
jgi:DNA-binding transcriptional LysR family regulator